MLASACLFFLSAFVQSANGHSLDITMERDHWRFLAHENKEHEDGSYLEVIKNNHVVAEYTPKAQPHLGILRLKLNTGYPVVALHGDTGIYGETLFVSIRSGKLVKMGHPPNLDSNGPVLWNGRPDIWAFDNSNHYERLDNPHWQQAIVLLRVGKDGRLHPYRRINTSHPNIPRVIRP